MLVDELIEGNEYLRKSIGGTTWDAVYAPVQETLEAAKSFDVTEDCMIPLVTVALGRPDNIIKGLPLLRPPFPKTWIEYNYSARQSAIELVHGLTTSIPHSHPDRITDIKRLGFLVEEVDEGLLCISFSWAPRDKKRPPEPCPIGYLFDTTPDRRHSLAPPIDEDVFKKHQEAYEAKKKEIAPDLETVRYGAEQIRAGAEMDSRTAFITPQHLVPLKNEIERLVEINMGRPLTDREREEMYAATMSDLETELNYALSMILLLNSKNAIEQEDVNNAKINRARQRRGKRPLKDQTKVTLRLSRVQKNRAGEAGQTREAMREHLCRGHFKVRKTGVFWWNAHVRGAGSRLEQRYEVRT